MDTVGTEEAAQFLKDLHFVGPCWVGTAFVPFWGDTLRVNLYAVEDDRFTSWQLETLRAVLGYPRDLRGEFERQLFDYYQKWVYNCIEFIEDDGTDVSDQYAPRLSEPGQIWRLIDGPEVYILWSPRAESAVEFELDFTCSWDEEHGLGVRYRDWEIVDIGGYGG